VCLPNPVHLESLPFRSVCSWILKGCYDLCLPNLPSGFFESFSPQYPPGYFKILVWLRWPLSDHMSLFFRVCTHHGKFFRSPCFSTRKFPLSSIISNLDFFRIPSSRSFSPPFYFSHNLLLPPFRPVVDHFNCFFLLCHPFFFKFASHFPPHSASYFYLSQFSGVGVFRKKSFTFVTPPNLFFPRITF